MQRGVFLLVVNFFLLFLCECPIPGIKFLMSDRDCADLRNDVGGGGHTRLLPAGDTRQGYMVD